MGGPAEAAAASRLALEPVAVGLLHIGMGDGGGAFDPGRRAQDPTALLGKILRIDVDPPAASAGTCASPPDNPFAGPDPGRDEIFALGFRNPWRFSFDRATGALYVGDVGGLAPGPPPMPAALVALRRSRTAPRSRARWEV